MADQRNVKSPFWHRFFIFILSVILGVLLYWLLTFILSDINRIPGPDYNKIVAKHVQQDLVDQKTSVSDQIRDIQKKISREQQKQKALKNSTDSLQQTINQLLKLPNPNESIQKSLADSQDQFLENQNLDQQYSQSIQDMTNNKVRLEEQLDIIETGLKPKYDKAQKEYNSLRNKHAWKIAFIKLAILIPLFLIGSWLFAKKRSGAYGPIVWSIFIVLFIKIGIVIHDVFPAEYFKYIVLLVVIAIVIRILVYMLRLVFSPKREFIIKQYQQSYDKGICPVCSKPILSGPFPIQKVKKYKFILKDKQSGSRQDSQPYCCPSCGTKLYGLCPACKQVRHLLLPFCSSCGDEMKDN